MLSLEDILDELSVRFITELPPNDLSPPERLYFIIEESYWFFIDFYVPKYRHYLRFRDFCQRILEHNNLKFSATDFRAYKLYKRKVPVYGAIIVNSKMDHVLLVRGNSNINYFFPKGKKCMNEPGIECAVREIYEEVGLDIKTKITSKKIETERGIFYFVFNVGMDQKFETHTRKEISDIRWVSLYKIREGNGPYTVIKDYAEPIDEVLKRTLKNQFKLDVERLERRMDMVCV